MFSGSDSGGEGMHHFNNFCMANPGGGSIDWGQLAQQWIQMRDNNEDVGQLQQFMNPPPPPDISHKPMHNAKPVEEQGEADMEMDDEDENTNRIQQTMLMRPDLAVPPPPAPRGILPQQWASQNNAARGHAVMNAVHPTAASDMHWNVNMWPPRSEAAAAANVPAINISGTSTNLAAGNINAHIPSLLNMNVVNPNSVKPSTAAATDTSSNTMDAAKRKMLPAWIREGLEKMERQKQKQMESQQKSSPSHDHESDLDKSPNNVMVKNNTLKLMASYEDEEDDQSSGNEDAVAAELDADSDNLHTKIAVQESHVPITMGKTYEQRLSDLMIAVRRTLTELLLEVTNEEISQVTHETLKSHKTKASSAQVIRKSALTSITGKLGLAAYNDSSSEDNDSDSDKADSSQNDSEDEIKAAIRQKRRAFIKTSEEIEHRIALAAQHEEETLKYNQFKQNMNTEKSDSEAEDAKDVDGDTIKNSSSSIVSSSSKEKPTYSGSGKVYEKDSGEPTDSKFQQSNGKRHKERLRRERTTRFSDNKDSNSVALAQASLDCYSMQQNTAPAIQTQVIAAATANTVPLYPLTTGMPDLNGLYTAAQPAITASSETAHKSRERSPTATERKSSHKRRHQQSSSDESDSSGSDSDSSSSSNSENSKYSRSSSSKHHKRLRRDSYSRGNSKSSSSRKTSSTSHKYSERDRDRDYSSRHKHGSSRRRRSDDSDNESSHHHSSSRRHRRYHERSRSRSHARSHSSYSSSSSRRRH